MEAARTKSVKRKPGYTWEQFEAYNRLGGERLRGYKPRSNGIVVGRRVRAEIAPDRAFELHACNADARISYGWVALHHVARCFASKCSDRKLGWLTIAADIDAVPEAEAASYDPTELKRWICEQLAGSSFLGCVEAAHYTNVGEICARANRVVHWHGHTLIWAGSSKRLRQIEKHINDSTRSLLPGLPAAYLRIVTQEEALHQLLYMLKIAAGENRVWPKKNTVIDWQTGEVTKVPTGRFRQSTRQARPGNLARMATIMSGLRIDDLMFAGGEGEVLLRRINKDVARQFRS